MMNNEKLIIKVAFRCGEKLFYNRCFFVGGIDKCGEVWYNEGRKAVKI